MAQPALAQNQDKTGQQQLAHAEQQQLTEADMEFATDAAEGGLKEVQLGQLAQQQAESEEVKQFGQRMVEDHGRANEQLMQIAQQKGIELPQELSEDAQQLYEELQQKSGAEFQEYAETGQDPDLTSFAEQTLPVLQEHLELAQQTQKQISAAVGPDQSPATGTAGEHQQAAKGQDQQYMQSEKQPAAM